VWGSAGDGQRWGQALSGGLLAKGRPGAERIRQNPRAGTKICIKPASHMLSHIMKATLDLPNNLLTAAKALAAQRETTLRAMVEHASLHTRVYQIKTETRGSTHT